MKSKKKLLLMGVGVMGALAMGVGATSTFAWFAAANTLQINRTANDNLSVANTTVSISLDLQHLLKYELAPVTPVTGLAEYDASPATGSNGYSVNLSTAYVDEAGEFHHIHGDGGRVLYSQLKVNISVDWTAKGAGDHGWTYAAGDSEDKTKWSYVEDGISYSYATIKSELAKNTTVTVYARESDTSRARFFKTTAVEGNLKLGGFAAGDKTTISAKEYVAVGTVSVAGSIADTNEHMASASLPTSGAGINFYVYGGNEAGTADVDDRSTNPVNGAIDLVIKTTTYTA